MPDSDAADGGNRPGDSCEVSASVAKVLLSGSWKCDTTSPSALINVLGTAWTEPTHHYWSGYANGVKGMRAAERAERCLRQWRIFAGVPVRHPPRGLCVALVS
ncbi:hypothetical protein GCM10009817_18040 [Terrabacter lapilli]|uniref:Uncharacterized protein n=1 Tax=Terrabacter lapilli TaxID=436231 RepID=A0ABN2S092_9MICO